MNASAALPALPVDCGALLAKAQLYDARVVGALVLAYCASWTRGGRGLGAGTLPDDDAELVRIMHTTSRAALRAVRQEFTPSHTPGVLRSAYIEALFAEKLARYESARLRGRKGGRPKGPSGKAELSRPKTTNELTPPSEKEEVHSSFSSEEAAIAVAGCGGAAPADPPLPELEAATAVAWAQRDPARWATIEASTDARMAAIHPRWPSLAQLTRAVRPRILSECALEAYAQARGSPPLDALRGELVA